MPRLSVEQKIEKAKQQKEKAEAEIKRSTKILKERDRKKDARQKIILGALLIERAKTDKYARKAIMDIFRVMGERDVPLFDGWRAVEEARKPRLEIIPAD